MLTGQFPHTSGMYGLAHRGFSLHEMLFDLDFDPGERKNLIKELNYQDVQNEMRELLERHMRETGDFVESGRIPRPEGIVLNKITCVDPDSENPSDYESEGERT